MSFKIKSLILSAILLAVLMGFASAASFQSYQQSAYNPPVPATFDTSMCNGQDFIVQISPSGCTPAVVRSDLLSQQDVPVFCPLVASQLNPLIDVKSISGISFSGNYSKYVKSIGFYPAQAALSLSGDTETNYPVLQNIGYVVIDLKQMQNESMMPGFVSGNLTARLKYSAENIFGVGNTIFYLPVMSDTDWQSQSALYGFWNNKGFLRATNIEGDGATIQLYDSNLGQTTSTNLKVGQTSNALPISGFSLCTATMQMKLEGIADADTTVKLSVNGNEMNVVKNQPFLNNQCSVAGFSIQGLTQEIDATCKTDSGKQEFALRVSPTITLTITQPSGTTTKDYHLGDFLYNDGGQPVFLGYIGTVGNDGFTMGNFPLKSDNSNLDVVLVRWPKDLAHQELALTNDELSSVAGWVQGQSMQWQNGIGQGWNILNNIGKFITGIGDTVLRLIVQGQDFAIITKGESSYNKDAANSAMGGFYYSAHNVVKIKDFAIGQDVPLKAPTSYYYENATNDYQTVVDSYAGEVYSQVDKTPLDMRAESQQITLADFKGQKNTLYNLCNDFKQRFSKEKVPAPCSNAAILSSDSSASYYVSINGQAYLISLESISTPAFKDFGAEISVRNEKGIIGTYQLMKDQTQLLNVQPNAQPEIPQNSGSEVSHVFKYNSLYYQFSLGNWYWSRDQTNWIYAADTSALSGDSAAVTAGLKGQTYSGGLKLLEDRTIATGNPLSLASDFGRMTQGKQFTIIYAPSGAVAGKYSQFDFKFDDSTGKWMWHPDNPDYLGSWLPVSDTSNVQIGYSGAPKSLIEFLNGKDFYSGAERIFSSTSTPEINSPITPSTTQSSGNSNNDFVQLRNVGLGGSSGDGEATFVSATQTVTLKKGESKQLGNYVITLNYVRLTQFAQVSLNPTVSNAGASANFSFNIGIEKRAIKLTPQQIKDKIISLNSSISTWQGISNFTNTTSTMLSKACTVTGYALFVKAFVDNLNGMGVARQIVMNGANGWYTKCANPDTNNGKSVEQCLIEHSKDIDSAVNEVDKYVKDQNTEMKTLQKDYTKSTILGGETVDTNGFMNGSKGTSYLSIVNSALSKANVPCKDPQNQDSLIDTSNLLSYQNYQRNFFSVTDARNVELYSKIASTSTNPDVVNMANTQICSTLTNVALNYQKQKDVDNIISSTKVDSAHIISTEDNVRTLTILSPVKYSTVKDKYPAPVGSTINPDSYVDVVKDSSKNALYLINYGPDGSPIATYQISNDNKLSLPKDALGKTISDPNPLNIRYTIPTSTSYNNIIRDPKVQYFETEPYKGMPALVPFDTQHGWYAAIQQNVPSPAIGGTGTTTATQSYTAGGQIQSFFLCNVGPNGIAEFNSGISDDQCSGINPATNQPYKQFPGITDSNQVNTLVNKAMDAITEAASAKARNPTLTTVVINNQNIPVGQPATNLPALKCTDFMSPGDCNILFNLCDPVICPPSRCDFGGAFPVQDVVQSGVIGSILLCLPNSVMLGGTDAIPVCLPGIQAGIDNWVSVQKSYRDCLQSNLDSGKTTGICDEMNSIYMCQFWWQQAQPLADLGVSTAASLLTGQSPSSRGGGEYLFVQDAMQKAQQSSNYITQYYAANSAKAFKLQSTQNLGSAVCQNFISVNLPGGADIANSLSTIDSPPQYMGTFQEIPFTTATVPPTSQYQVYYHIYAGKNSGVYYSIYLQRSSSSSYYRDTSSTRQVDSGYLAAGASADQTKDFTATSGYNQLCINVNGDVKCDFQQVTTSLALKYIKDQYVANQVNDTQISSESACVSGTADVGSFMVNANLQNGASDYLNPEIYKYGITRICATSNPGLGTDQFAGSQNSRWVQVGTCGNANLKCWLDTQSVKNAINSPDINSFLQNNSNTQTLQSATLQSVNDNYEQILLGSDYLNNGDFETARKEIESQKDPRAKIDAINKILDRIFYNNQKAYLYLLRGDAYASLANGDKSQSCDELGGMICTSGQTCNGGFARSSDPRCCTSDAGCVTLRKITPASTPTTPANTATGGNAQTTAGGNNQGTSTNTNAPCSSITTSTAISICSSFGLTGTFRNQCSDAMVKTGTTLDDAISICSSFGLTGTFRNQCVSAITNCGSTTAGSAGIVTSDDLANAMTNSQVNCQCGSNCKSYADSLINAANANGEDPVLLLSIMIQESQCSASAHNDPSVGIMQVNINENNLKQCYSISGISSSADVTGTSLTSVDKNIKCGALILKNKYTAYSGGQKYPDPKTGLADCGGFSETYSGWKAAVRGYLGYGCVNDPTIDVPSYVDSVYNRYNLLTSIIMSSKASAQSSANSGTASQIQQANQGTTSGTGSSTTAIAAADISKFNTYKTYFKTYSQAVPSGAAQMSKNDFEALLVAIANQNNWGNGNAANLMGNTAGRNDVVSQVQVAADILNRALTNPQDSKISQTYNDCVSRLTSDDLISCVLSVYKTGKTDYGKGISSSFIGPVVNIIPGVSNSDGINYAKSVMTLWTKWKSYPDL